MCKIQSLWRFEGVFDFDVSSKYNENSLYSDVSFPLIRLNLDDFAIVSYLISGNQIVFTNAIPCSPSVWNYLFTKGAPIQNSDFQFFFKFVFGACDNTNSQIFVLGSKNSTFDIPEQTRILLITRGDEEAGLMTCCSSDRLSSSSTIRGATIYFWSLLISTVFSARNQKTWM